MNVQKMKGEKTGLLDMSHGTVAFDSVLLMILVMISLDLTLPYAFDQLEHAHFLETVPFLRPFMIPGGTPHPLVILGQELAPFRLLLRTVSIFICILYLLLDFVRGRTEFLKNSLLGVLIFLHVLLPTFLFMTHRVLTGSHDLAHDGGVLQIEESMRMVLEGRNPYSEDFTGTPLDGWRGFRNNIVYHLPYMPGAFLTSLPVYACFRLLNLSYDQRMIHMIALVVMVYVVFGILRRRDLARAVVIVAVLNPFFSRFFILGSNDVILMALLMTTVLCLNREMTVRAFACLGVACAIKQFAWFFVPFFILHLPKPEPFRILPMLLHHQRALLTGLVVFTGFVLPFLAMDPGCFWQDTFQYAGGGLPTSYPMQGFHGFGFATVLLFLRIVPDGSASFPFGVIQVATAALFLILFFRSVRKLPLTLASSTTGASLLLFIFLFFSRYLHANFLGVVAVWPFLAWCLKADTPEV